ncbi:LOW QUALITY PROTEIN: protein bicaudal D-like [Tachypleus tridentatus]|uniref:LOW QUALITY PROTEIN: protein bicaudal D-like n=1 Tax=Tachypleus tridentatus TaxID=6853 RepID=UPI003FD0E977
MGDSEKLISELTIERDNLKDELERLHRELAQTSHEKIQSAQYGLVLLDEKEVLQQRCEELEALFDGTKHELDCLKEAFAKSQTSQKMSATTGIEQEESLLKETAHKEASFTSTVQELEREIKQVKQELARVEAERDRIHQDYLDLFKQNEVSEWEKKNLKSELKEMKLREGRLFNDNNELEDENISLQKQVSSLRSSQVEFEGAKHEVRRLQEEVESLNGQVEEMTSLKRIAEKQLEEALEALQSEREQKYALKKELDNRLNRESIFNLNNLTLSNFRFGNQEDGNRTEEEDGESDVPALKQLEADYIGKHANDDSDKLNESQPATVNDLFSELHLSEVRKLEKQLEQAENEKSQLNVRLEESQQMLEKTKNELSDQHNRVAKVIDHVKALIALHGKVEDIGESGSGEEGDKDIPELVRLQKLLQKHQKRYQLAVQKVEELQADVQNLQEQGADQNSEESLAELRDEVTKLRKKVQHYEQQLTDTKDDLLIVGEIAGESQGRLSATQEDLVNVSEELAQLYHHVCMVNGETPSRVMLDHVKGCQENKENEGQDSSGQYNVEKYSKLDLLKEKLKTDVSSKLFQDGHGKVDISKADPTVCGRLLETIHDQVRHLKQSVQTTIEMGRQKVHHSASPEDAAEMEELQEQVIKLKSLLSTKREQIATLRTVLKANKQTAEVALANLKSKYEKEKSIVSETMIKLRNELKALKEDAATFASLRAMFAARCEEYVTQVEELQRQLGAAEEEKKTLNSLLRMAIQQKLALTQRLEDVEMDRERSHMRRQDGRGRGSYQRRGKQSSTTRD